MQKHVEEHADVSQPRLYREDSWGPHFARLRREDPVHRHAESPFGPYWSVTRHADIMKVELDPATYSSASELGGIQITDQPQGEELPNFTQQHQYVGQPYARMCAVPTLYQSAIMCVSTN